MTKRQIVDEHLKAAKTQRKKILSSRKEALKFWKRISNLKPKQSEFEKWDKP